MLRRITTISSSIVLVACLLSACAAGHTVVKTVTVTASASPAGTGGDPAGLGAGSSAQSAAASTAGDADQADAALDPCTLLTQAEAGKLSGVAMLAGDSVKGQSCEYDTDPNGATSQVTIFIDAGAKETYDLDSGLGHTFTPVNGLGDKAYIETGAAFLVKGQRWVQVSDSFLDDSPASTARLKAALATIASRF